MYVYYIEDISSRTVIFLRMLLIRTPVICLSRLFFSDRFLKGRLRDEKIKKIRKLRPEVLI